VSDDDARDRWLTAALAEYQALRTEIIERIRIEQLLLGLAITVLGALLSLAIAGESSRASLLLAAPFVMSTLGFAYSDHARRINMLGAYITNRLWPDVRSLTDSRLSSWDESFVEVVSLRTPIQALLSSAGIVTLFVLAPIAADLYVGIALKCKLTSAEWALLISGLATTLLYAVHGTRVAVGYRLERLLRRSSSGSD
jgi:hypothetical protein